MRLSFLLLALLFALPGCTSENASAIDSGVTVSAEDGSTIACTSVGGTCVPYAASNCPREQQNSALCESVILLCCLPAGSVSSGGPPSTDAGTLADATQSTGMDATQAAGMDATQATGMDAMQSTGMDATQTTGMDATTESDAPVD